MHHKASTAARPGRFPGRRPEAVRVSSAELVSGSYLDAGRFPRVLRPAPGGGLDPVGWAGSGRELIGRELLSHGAVLLRGFGLRSAEEFARFASALSPQLLDYQERAAPRTRVSGKVFTSTEYPPDQPIPLHHEMSYSHNWPAKIMFFCARPPERGGRTPIASDRTVFKLINPRIKERFIEKRIMYVRNYGPGLDLPWQEVFQTHDRAAVEEYCRRWRIRFEWRGADRLRTAQVRQAVATHPVTGECVWFNHAHLFHPSGMDARTRASLVSMLDEEDWPRNAFYGDGSPIEDSVLEEIRGTYDAAAVAFDWERGDILLLDNFLASHGREPYSGARQILVAMAELFTNEET